jgi:hypothetical protein
MKNCDAWETFQKNKNEITFKLSENDMKNVILGNRGPKFELQEIEDSKYRYSKKAYWKGTPFYTIETIVYLNRNFPEKYSTHKKKLEEKKIREDQDAFKRESLRFRIESNRLRREEMRKSGKKRKHRSTGESAPRREIPPRRRRKY